jgi:anti-sigma regulatory factor (Ser/Thr protein kinase)
MGFETQASWVLPRDMTAASMSRRHVLSTCSELPEDTRHTAALLTDEVVVNALQHGTGEIALFITCAPDRIRIEVHDENPEPPVVVEPDRLAESGRGLMLVEAMARAWGARPSAPPEPGKRVWFEL